MHDEQQAKRRSHRAAVMMPARCRSRSGFVDRGTISNISLQGCRFESHALTLHVGDLVVMTPDGLEGLCGQVRWVHGHSAGIEFQRPFYAPVFEHLCQRHARYAALVSTRHEPLRRAA